MLISNIVIMFSFIAQSIKRSSVLKSLPTKFTQRTISKCTVLYAKKKVTDGDDADWVTVNFGDKEQNKDMDMMDRIKDAEKWESQQMTDDEFKKINKLLGIEKELLQYEEEEIQKHQKKKLQIKDSKSKLKALMDVADDRSKLKGFLEMNPYICSGCGTPFQSKREDEPGYLPTDKFKVQQQKAEEIKESQEAIRVLDMAGIDIGSPVAEQILQEAGIAQTVIEGVLHIGRRFSDNSPTLSSSSSSSKDSYSATSATMKVHKNKINKQLLPQQQPSDEEITNNETAMNENTTYNVDGTIIPKDRHHIIDEVCICQRCFRLQQYGKVESILRPGWSNHELLTPERFETLLSTIKNTPSVVTCIIDIFDLKGSILRNLKTIVGDNPLVIAVNKVDLMPKDISKERIIDWIHEEIQYVCKMKSAKAAAEMERNLRNQFPDSYGSYSGTDASSSSSSSSSSTSRASRRKPIREVEYGIIRRANIHLISCQSGLGMDEIRDKLMNLAGENANTIHVMGAANVGKSSFINFLLGEKVHGKRTQRAKGSNPRITVSNLPGTTLDFLKIKLSNGVTVIDTPGLIKDDQLTARLTIDELKQVIPVKPINPITLRIEQGKTVMLGGLAAVELVEGLPFFFTFFISNEVVIRPTDAIKHDEFLQKHIGKLVFPPATYERIKEIGEFDEYDYDIQGEGWLRSAVDIVISGLGWVSITGVGACKIRVKAPSKVGVALRSPLLPFEASHSTVKFTGSRIIKKSRKPGGQKSYGWRAS